MKFLLVAIAATALVAVDEARAAASPEDGAKAFYAVYSTFHPSDGIPDAKARARYAPTVSRALEALLVRAGDVETKFENAHKDSPPLIEGDLMTSNFEGATSIEVEGCVTKNLLVANCKVGLAYEPAPGLGRAVRWTDTLILIASSGEDWRVDDIVYGATWAFGNKGRLTESLRRAIADAGS